MKYLIYLFIIIIISLESFADDYPENYQSKMKIYLIGWNTTTNSQISPNDYFDIYKLNIVEICNERIINALIIKIRENDSLYNSNLAPSIDVRLGIIISYDNDSISDTICFSNFDYYYYNSNYYTFSDCIFDYILKLIPVYEVKTIEFRRSLNYYESQE